MTNNRKPKVGEQIYLPSSLNVYKGASDFTIGFFPIDSIDYNKLLSKEDYNFIFISIVEILKENEGAKYNWNWVFENQENWEILYKSKVA